MTGATISPAVSSSAISRAGNAAEEPAQAGPSAGGGPSMQRQQTPGGLTSRAQASSASGPSGAAPQFKDVPTRWDGVVIRTKPEHSKKFAKQVEGFLETIDSQPAGHQVLQGIHDAQVESNLGYKVAFMPVASERKEGALDKLAKASSMSAAAKRKVAFLGLDGKREYTGSNVTIAANEVNASTPGKGSPSAIRLNPQQEVTPDGKRPPFIGAAHELIHAMRNLQGESKLRATEDMPDPRRIDEMEVTGLGEFDQPGALTENNIRREHNLEERTGYAGITDEPAPEDSSSAAASAAGPTQGTGAA
jgi:hypothetical protein